MERLNTKVSSSNPAQLDTTATRLTRRWAGRTALCLGFGGLAAGIVYAHAQRHTHHVSVRPGETVSMTIEVPMQRTFEHKSYAQRRGLPVRCTISGNQVGGGVDVHVVRTGHRVHLMWATLSIHAASEVVPGTSHARRVAFTISDQGGWPEATILIHVRQ